MRTSINELGTAIKRKLDAATLSEVVAIMALCAVVGFSLERLQPGLSVVQSVYGFVVTSGLSLVILTIVVGVSLGVAFVVFGIMTLAALAQLAIAFVVFVFFGNAVHDFVSDHALHLTLTTVNTIAFVIVAAVLGLLSPLMRPLPVHMTTSSKTTSPSSERRLPANH